MRSGCVECQCRRLKPGRRPKEGIRASAPVVITRDTVASRRLKDEALQLSTGFPPCTCIQFIKQSAVVSSGVKHLRLLDREEFCFNPLNRT
ncbi:hypothetical protein EYF80_039932 [Liparis tanakae]|uniref:Uncharacterized protein n=1 Tax=Liparis tanakae TaxID=230148 RepID=A0A4Z2G9J6_9TELE|nr:hypothetical protein EYF80_039932 [Liparis tanakae]